MPIRLLVGLGNPGREYEATRHNAGFWWVENLAEVESVRLQAQPKFFGRTGRITKGGGDCWLLLPQTFMNLSGRAVQALATFYKIAPDEILVVHDELDLQPGDARLKKGGGVAGHNGLKDIAAHLGPGLLAPAPRHRTSGRSQRGFQLCPASAARSRNRIDLDGNRTQPRSVASDLRR